jgi:hypothetical protein
MTTAPLNITTSILATASRTRYMCGTVLIPSVAGQISTLLDPNSKTQTNVALSVDWLERAAKAVPRWERRPAGP